MSKKKYILITVSGQDQPGITANLMGVISKNSIEVMDMGQAVTHGLLSLSILLNIPESSSGPVLKDLLFESKKMGLELDFKIIENGQTENQEEERFILSCVSVKSLTAAFIGDLAATLAIKGINIHRIDNTNKKFNSLEITTSCGIGTDWDDIKEELLKISDQYKVDMAFLRDNVFRRSKRLIVFDMDSTLIQTEIIDEMARLHGVGEKVASITYRAMNGELDFTQSLTQRVSMLKGLKINDLNELNQNLPLTPGVEEFISIVKGLGFKVAVISGGFTYFTNTLKEKLGLDYAFANELEVEGGHLTGKLKGSIIDGAQKAFLLDLIAQQEGIHLEQVVAIGDGANDLEMLSKAGLGIAFHAKEAVKQSADQNMSHGPMTSILHFLGIHEANGSSI